MHTAIARLVLMLSGYKSAKKSAEWSDTPHSSLSGIAALLVYKISGFYFLLVVAMVAELAPLESCYL